MIPRIIHFVWIGGAMPAWASRNVEEFQRLNPGHNVRVHGEDVLLAKYRNRYGACTQLCQKSDLLRLSALETSGGWYFDVDYWPLRPVSDAERAYLLRNNDFFCTDSGRPSGVTNATLAVGTDWQFWPAVSAAVAAAQPSSRNAFGPSLLNRLVRKMPDAFRVGPAAWWNGVDMPMAPSMYRKCINSGPDVMRRWIPATGGQLPFAFHLWAGTNAARLESVEHDGKPYCMVFAGARRSVYPWDAIAAAMNKLGYNADIKQYDDPLTDLPDVAFIWNGINEQGVKVVERCRRMGAQVVFLEHGFFDRQHYCQADTHGILHRASWASSVMSPAPACGAERLARFYPQGLRPIKPRHGYILVLGQVAGDTQMVDSEIRGPVPLQRILARAVPRGTKIFFRPHPLCSNIKPHPSHRTLPRLPEAGNEVPGYRQSKHGAGLREALHGASFVVAINSNAMVEALAEGVPCLAFGPSTAIAAGVAHPTSCATLKDDLRDMMHGWCPPQDKVDNYLQWLAARQWNIEEFARPELLQQILAGTAAIECCGPAGQKKQTQEAVA